MSKTTIYYGLHNNQVKLYVVINGKRKNKALSFFGNNYKVETPIKHWDNENKCFVSKIDRNTIVTTAKEDNKRLEELLRILEELASIREYSNCDDFFAAYKTANSVEAAKVPTLLEFAKIYAQLWKDNKVMGKDYDYKSGNYVIYEKFVRRLQGYQYKELQPWANEIKVFADTPITEIDNDKYNDFVYFLIAHKLPIKDSLNAFRAMVYYYQHWILRKRNFKFALFADYKKSVQKSKKRKTKAQTLTNEQVKQIAQLDVKAVCPKMDDARKQLYKDTLLLMYGLVTRPFDILSMKIEDIKKEEYGYYWEYCANKLRNTKGEADKTPIQQGCWEIISKYIGKRKKGFVLPFSINETEKPQQQRKIQVSHTSVNIGKFLKAIASYYNWDIDIKGLSMYTLRHTAITDLLKVHDCWTIATWAHTSVKEINDTYADRNKLAQSACPNTFAALGI